MNKNFLSLALVAVLSISFSVFAEEKKVEAKVSDMPECALEIEKEINDQLVQAEKNVKELQEKLTEATKERDEQAKNKDADLKEFNLAVDKATKALVEAEIIAGTIKSDLQSVKNNHKDLFDKSFMNKATTPARYIARLIANNNSVALALEITGVAGVSYAIYKSFFAQEEEDEDSL